jgi:hypothetical protein
MVEVQNLSQPATIEIHPFRAVVPATSRPRMRSRHDPWLWSSPCGMWLFEPGLLRPPASHPSARRGSHCRAGQDHREPGGIGSQAREPALPPGLVIVAAITTTNSLGGGHSRGGGNRSRSRAAAHGAGRTGVQLRWAGICLRSPESPPNMMPRPYYGYGGYYRPYYARQLAAARR